MKRSFLTADRNSGKQYRMDKNTNESHFERGAVMGDIHSDHRNDVSCAEHAVQNSCSKEVPIQTTCTSLYFMLELKLAQSKCELQYQTALTLRPVTVTAAGSLELKEQFSVEGPTRTENTFLFFTLGAHLGARSSFVSTWSVSTNVLTYNGGNQTCSTEEQR